jgi:phosphoserine phosphatase
MRLVLLQKKHGYRRVAMVGDGATDLEARLPDAANIFIG